MIAMSIKLVFSPQLVLVHANSARTSQSALVMDIDHEDRIVSKSVENVEGRAQYFFFSYTLVCSRYFWPLNGCAFRVSNALSNAVHAAFASSSGPF